MDKLVDTLTSFPSPSLFSSASDLELSKQGNIFLTTALYRIPALTLNQSIGSTDVLDLVNPEVNSLSFLYILTARIDTGTPDTPGTIWPHLCSFLQKFDQRQTRLAPREFRRTVEAFIKYATSMDKPIMAVKVLKKTILRNTPERFSFMHRQFVELCLLTQCYRDAVAVLEADVWDFPGARGKDQDSSNKANEVTYQDVLEFYLFGGLIYIGLKNWRRAFEYLTYVVTAPGSACSAIQVEAYKKYILVNLLLEGRPPNIPRIASGSATRAYKALCKPYEAFALAFRSGNADNFRQEIGYTAEQFRNDGNTGLAVQCMDAFRRHQIVALRDTYVTLSIEEIASKDFEVTGRGGDVGTKEETERLVLGMIERGELQASLAHDSCTRSSMVHFHSNPIIEAENLRALEQQINRTVALTAQVRAMDRRFGLTKDYLQFSQKTSSGKQTSVGLFSQTGGDLDMMDYDYGGNPLDDEMAEASLAGYIDP